MGVKETRRMGSFTAKDAKGSLHTIYVFQDFIDVGTLSNPNEVAPGMRSLKTQKGEHVNSLGNGQYEIVGFVSTLLTSDDPKQIE